MSMLEKRSSGALASSTVSGTVGKGLLVAGTGAGAVWLAAAILPMGFLFWAVIFVIAGFCMVEK